MKSSHRIIHDISKLLSSLFKGIILSLLFIFANIVLFAFMITFKDPDGVIATIGTVILALGVYPAFCAILYAARKDSNLIQSFVYYYRTHYKVLYQLSAIFLGAFVVLVVDGIYFKTRSNLFLKDVFTGLALLVVVYSLNKALVVSSFEAPLKKVLITSFAYTKELTGASLVSLVMMVLPFKLGPLIYLLVIGLAALIQTVLYRKTYHLMLEKITDPSIKYL